MPIYSYQALKAGKEIVKGEITDNSFAKKVLSQQQLK